MTHVISDLPQPSLYLSVDRFCSSTAARHPMVGVDGHSAVHGAQPLVVKEAMRRPGLVEKENFLQYGRGRAVCGPVGRVYGCGERQPAPPVRVCGAVRRGRALA